MRRRRREAASEAAGIALPFVSALLVIGAGWVLSWLSDRWGHPIRRPKGIVGPLNCGSNEDTSAFGPLGAVLMYALPLLTIAAVARGRFDARRVALAASVPLFVLLLVLESKWNEFLTRFLVVPVVLGAPLLAYLFAPAPRDHLVRGGRIVRRAADDRACDREAAQRAAVEASRRCGRSSRPQNPEVAAALARFQRLVPPRACVGAVLGLDEPAYLLYGPGLRHHVEYLPVTDAVHQALLKALFYVVISTGPNRTAADDFRRAGLERPPARLVLAARVGAERDDRRLRALVRLARGGLAADLQQPVGWACSTCSVVWSIPKRSPSISSSSRRSAVAVGVRLDEHVRRQRGEAASRSPRRAGRAPR